VLTVKVTLFASAALPSSVTLVGLKVQSAPAGRPAVQLPGLVPVLELKEFAKLMVCVEPFTGVKVNVVDVGCPAATEAGETVPTDNVKSLTVTDAGEDVES
jgi:hypothetical protein